MQINYEDNVIEAEDCTSKKYEETSEARSRLKYAIKLSKKKYLGDLWAEVEHSLWSVSTEVQTFAVFQELSEKSSISRPICMLDTIEMVIEPIIYCRISDAVKSA